MWTFLVLHHTAYTRKHKCGCKSFPWKSIHTKMYLRPQRVLCLPLFPALQSPSKILPYKTSTFTIKNLVYFNRITPSANLQEPLFFKYKSPLGCSSPTDIYFKGPVSVNAPPGCNTFQMMSSIFSTEILGLENWTGARVSFHIHHITKWCTGYIYGLISAG